MARRGSGFGTVFKIVKAIDRANQRAIFRTDLKSIKQAVERITNGEADFKMTILAEEFYETRRLQGMETAAA